MLLQCRSKLLVCYCVHNIPKIQINCVCCISHLSPSFTEKDCQAGLAETQIQDLHPLISKVSGPHLTPMKYHQSCWHPSEVEFGRRVLFFTPGIKIWLQVDGVFFYIQQQRTVLRRKMKRLLWRVTLPHHSNTRDVSPAAPGSAAEWPTCHTSPGEPASTFARRQEAHQRDNSQHPGGCAGITKTAHRAARSATASHELL